LLEAKEKWYGALKEQALLAEVELAQREIF
jgi:hypothetical protein